ncbi:MAG: tripartite tricarboxylate transporter substrate binding protein [Proteobacteria bacterium]|nr:tripartite tricarboxylate transporter substrate binding protein [Burkholderiales bacterium]MCA0309418.1 tripartite tricarboxylate transporter substrate binding protein [Pseudomonadota bacterium]
MSLRRRQLMIAGAAGLAAAPFARVMAQTYPAKQINVVVSFPPGGDTDAFGRLFAEKMAARFNQPVIVENKTGASGTIGNAYVAKAAPDGYTLLFTPNTVATAPLVLKPGTGAVYDPLKDLTPIFLAGTQSLFLVANAATGIRSVKDLLAAVRAGKISGYASPGSGSPMHILGEMFNRAAGVKMTQIPYRGSGPAIVDLVGGQVQVMYTTLAPVAQYLAKGDLVNLAVADAQRSPLQPEVPSLAEVGVPGVEVGAWQGFMGPRGLPDAIVKTLNTQLNEIIRMPDVQERMKTLALVPVGGEPAALGRLVADHYQRFGKVIKEAGIVAG